MLIDGVEVFHLRLPTTDTVLVRMQSGIVSGWGEACVGREPVDSCEWSGSVFAFLKDFLAPAVLEQSVITGDQLQAHFERYRGNTAAKSAIDIAWWDLEARTHATSVSALLGGSGENRRTSICLEVKPTIDDLLAAIGELELNDNTLLLKYRPGWDEQMLRAVRQIYPAISLAIDCDGCCRLGQRELLYRLDDFMLQWIEQPFPAEDLVSHAMLQEAIRTPICLHQSITSLDRVEQALDLGSCKAMRIDPNFVGGLTPAREIHQLCHGSQMALAAGGTIATSVGAAALASLATMEGFSLPADQLVPLLNPQSADFDRQQLLDFTVAHAVI